MNRNNNLNSEENRPIWFPARIDAEQTAKLLGFQAHDIPILICQELLKPLGKPAPNARKYFARVEVIQIAEDANWLARATKALYQHWKQKKDSRAEFGSDAELSCTE